MALILGNPKHSKKGTPYYMLDGWLKSGLLTSFGTKWQWRRKILTPAFHYDILQDFVQIFNECTEKTVEILKKKINEPFIEINPLITHLALKIVVETVMGIETEFVSKKETEYKNALYDLIEKIAKFRFCRPHTYYKCFYIFTKAYYKEIEILKILHGFTKEIIKKRREEFYSGAVNIQKKKRLAMLDLLLKTQKEEGIIDDEGIQEEVDTFLFEGHDTVSSSLNFALLLVANHPDVQEKIVEEMREVLGDIKKKPLYSDLQKLKYMEMCLKESSRLYPVCHFLSRELGEDLITQSGYKLKKGTIVNLHLYDMHHNPEIYPDPEKFDPDRFLPENCDKRHPYAFLPFSAGPRNCIGQKSAMLEMKAVLCGILSNFILEPVDTPESIVMIAFIILKTKSNIKIRFVKRDS